MARVKFDLRTRLPPERVMSMLTDFSARRPNLWPTLVPELYKVHRLEPGSACVEEGSLFPALIWERVENEWWADRVRWTVRKSNYCKPGSYVEVTVGPGAGGGSRVRVEWNRRGDGFKGKILIALVVLTRGANIRQKVFQSAFDRAARQLRNG
jgi:hypothetical protein